MAMRRAWLVCALGAVVCAAGQALANEATLVRDINGAPRVISGAPRKFLSLGARTIFLAYSPEYGEEPWVTDGTPSGTRLLKDLEPGPDDLESGGFNCAARVGDGALLLSPSSARDESGGRTLALWSTDGTPEGTAKRSLLGGGWCAMVAVDDGAVIAVGRQESFQSWVLALWRSDANGMNLRLLKEFHTEYANLTELHAAGKQVFFTPYTDAGTELWRTDGTAAGTRMVADLVAGPESSYPGILAGLGRNVLFTAIGDGGGTDALWRSDGTAAGTIRLTELPTYSRFTPLALPDRVLIATDESIITTDGTRAGTTVRPIDFSIEGWERLGDDIVFFDTNHPTGLWRWRDLAGDPERIAEVPGLGGRRRVVGGLLFFLGYGADGARGVWRTDGTTDGTMPVFSEPESFVPFELGSNDERAFFPAWTVEHGAELWSSDGTMAGTAFLANTGSDDVYNESSNPHGLAAVGDRVVFNAAVDGGPFNSLWSSDGTAAGTTILRAAEARLERGLRDSRPVTFSGALYFPDVGGLWSTDGRHGGTALAVPTDLQGLRDLTAAGDSLYFVSGGDASPNSVCRSHASIVSCSPPIDRVGSLHALGDRVLFSGGPYRDQEPWISDGSAGGTHLIRDLLTREPGEDQGSRPSQFTYFDGELFFVGWSAFGEQGLWRSDGTDAGTRLVWSGTRIAGLTAAGAQLFFLTESPFDDGGTLWVSDGTTEGTRWLEGPLVSLPSSDSPRMPQLGGSVLFAGFDAMHGWELWMSDGTSSGTHIVQDLVPGSRSSAPGNFASAGDRVIFTAETAVGSEPWVTDGTSDGTHLLADVAPGIASSDARELLAVGGGVFTSATDGFRGRELWRIALDDTSCAGDCSADGTVSIADLISAVSVALGLQPVGACAAADADADGEVSISELIAAVRVALDGCA
ncbi:MAG: hypothetical protein SF182_28115 [Deltaproteobacteria bacterium]|nr:hypothetical protein [Deltaproteobacteria bacterium]